jgi:hypothetical protein
MKKDELVKQGAAYEEKYGEISEESFVHVIEKDKIPLSRVIQEGIYNIKLDNGQVISEYIDVDSI